MANDKIDVDFESQVQIHLPGKDDGSLIQLSLDRESPWVEVRVFEPDGNYAMGFVDTKQKALMVIALMESMIVMIDEQQKPD